MVSQRESPFPAWFYGEPCWNSGVYMFIHLSHCTLSFRFGHIPKKNIRYCNHGSMICSCNLLLMHPWKRPGGKQLPSSKLTWQWKFTFSNRKYIFKWWIFHSYVSLLEGSGKMNWFLQADPGSHRHLKWGPYSEDDPSGRCKWLVTMVMVFVP